jgi:putative ABC transport system permease protein
MLRVTLKGLLGRKLRLVLTSLAIVLGVAMVSGTFVLTDTIDAGIKSLFDVAYANTDAVVSGHAAFGDNGPLQAPAFPASTLGRIESLPGVSAAGGDVRARVEIVGADGNVVSRGGASGYGFSIDPGYERFTPLRLVTGSWPSGSDQVAIDAQTADSQHYAVGDRVGIIVKGGRSRRYTITGVVDYGSSTSLVGATLSVFDLAEARRLFGKEGRLDQIDVAARPGVTDAALVGQIRTVLPPRTEVRTSAQQAQQQLSDYGSVLDTFRYFLLAFGGIALFVGAFVIANTLSITVAQRRREFATLRTIGASTRQVRRAVILEGAVTGLVASVVGLFVGVGLAKGLEAVFKAEGVTLPLTGLVFATRTVIVSLAVGIVVTLLASLAPAIRATRVPPIAAVREGSVLPPSRLARLGPAIALVVTAVALVLVCLGAFVPAIPTGPRLIVLAAGVLGTFLGIAMIAPAVARPVARALGWPAAAFGGAAGALARSNATRNPARTAATAAALMIGLALVTAVAVLAQGLKQSVIGSVENEFRGDYVLTSVDGFTPTSVTSTEALRRAGIAKVVAGERSGQGRAVRQTVRVAGLDPGLSRLLVLNWKAGDNDTMATLGAHGAIVDSSFASSNKLAVGSSLTLETPDGGALPLAVRGIYKPPQAENPLGTVSISSTAFDSLYANPQNVFTLISTPGGVTPATTASLDRVLAPFPDAKIQSEQQFIASQEASIDSEINLLYILLALSVVVSLFGIVNTLVLTVFERTREIGMLRAIGMTRRQARRMIRHESVITALLGAALGIPVGIALAALFDGALGDIPFTVPAGRIVAFVVVAIVVGLLGAVFPARRASRLDILGALQYE